MSFKTNTITDKLKNTFIRFRTREQNERAQELMFRMGFKWASEERKIYIYSTNGYLMVDEACRITHVPFGHKYRPEGKEISFYELRQAADQVKAIRKAKRKDSRKRKAAARAATQVVSLGDLTEAIVSQDGWAEVAHVDKDGFIRWDGGECPVPEGAKFQVRFRGGFNNDLVNDYKVAGLLRWNHDGSGGDIVSYRLCPTVTPAPQADVFVEVPEVDPVPDTNPKKQYGLASIPLNLWSPLASAYGAVSLYNGSLKYGRGNYKATPVEASIYIAAAMRHLVAWAEGEEFDPADGCPNLGGVLANVAILLDARAGGTLIDDRQLPSGYLQEREMLKALVVKLQEVHAGKDPRHYTIADKK